MRLLLLIHAFVLVQLIYNFHNNILDGNVKVALEVFILIVRNKGVLDHRADQVLDLLLYYLLEYQELFRVFLL